MSMIEDFLREETISIYYKVYNIYLLHIINDNGKKLAIKNFIQAIISKSAFTIDMRNI